MIHYVKKASIKVRVSLKQLLCLIRKSMMNGWCACYYGCLIFTAKHYLVCLVSVITITDVNILNNHVFADSLMVCIWRIDWLQQLLITVIIVNHWCCFSLVLYYFLRSNLNLLYTRRLSTKSWCTLASGSAMLAKSSELMDFNLKHLSRSSMMISWRRKRTRKSWEWVMSIVFWIEVLDTFLTDISVVQKLTAFSVTGLVLSIFCCTLWVRCLQRLHDALTWSMYDFINA